MRMIKKILNNMIDYSILNVQKKVINEGSKKDYWDEYFKGKDILGVEYSYIIEPKEKKSKCKVFKFENYK